MCGATLRHGRRRSPRHRQEWYVGPGAMTPHVGENSRLAQRGSSGTCEALMSRFIGKPRRERPATDGAAPRQSNRRYAFGDRRFRHRRSRPPLGARKKRRARPSRAGFAAAATARDGRRVKSHRGTRSDVEDQFGRRRAAIRRAPSITRSANDASVRQAGRQLEVAASTVPRPPK